MSRALKITFAVAAALIVVVAVSVARAQQPPAPDPVTTLQQDWGAYQVQQKHVLDGINAVVLENQALRKERDELKAERDRLKAEADKKSEAAKPGLPANQP